MLVKCWCHDDFIGANLALQEIIIVWQITPNPNSTVFLFSSCLNFSTLSLLSSLSLDWLKDLTAIFFDLILAANANQGKQTENQKKQKERRKNVRKRKGRQGYHGYRWVADASLGMQLAERRWRWLLVTGGWWLQKSYS